MFRKIRPDIGTALATRRANELAFDIRQPDIIGPFVGAERHGMAASVVGAEHHDAAHARCAHFAEGDLLRAVRQNVPSFARCSAGDAGFLTLTQCAHGPAR